MPFFQTRRFKVTVSLSLSNNGKCSKFRTRLTTAIPTMICINVYISLPAVLSTYIQNITRDVLYFRMNANILVQYIRYRACEFLNSFCSDLAHN